MSEAKPGDGAGDPSAGIAVGVRVYIVHDEVLSSADWRRTAWRDLSWRANAPAAFSSLALAKLAAEARVELYWDQVPASERPPFNQAARWDKLTFCYAEEYAVTITESVVDGEG